MRISCPHCQVKGKVQDELAGTKVRCPKCEEIFIVESNENTPPTDMQTIGEVTTDTPATDILETEEVTTENPPTDILETEEVATETPPTDILETEEVATETPPEESSTEPTTLITCTTCGFTYSEQFITEKGEEKLCSVCAL